jgi:putative transposase
VRNKAVYIALGILADGTKEILGIWIEQTEGAKFWLRVMNELKTRGVGDILIAVVDGLKGFPEAINAVFPQTVVQTCIVHLIRHSLEFVSCKDRKTVMPALRAIYRAKDAEAGMKALEEFEAGVWGQRYPAIAGRADGPGFFTRSCRRMNALPSNGICASSIGSAMTSRSSSVTLPVQR